MALCLFPGKVSAIECRGENNKKKKNDTSVLNRENLL